MFQFMEVRNQMSVSYFNSTNEAIMKHENETKGKDIFFPAWPALLNKRQAAAYTSLSERTLERLAASGELQGRRIGSRTIRYRKQDIDVWIEGLESGRKGR